MSVNRKPAVRKNPSNYLPTEQEKYMSGKQLTYFLARFELMRRDILSNNEKLIDAMKDEVNSIPDENDRASKESEFAVELRERERERQLLQKIDTAIKRIGKKQFGHCEECGDPIGIKRLLARPVATLCFECKHLQEEFEKSGGTLPFVLPI